MTAFLSQTLFPALLNMSLTAGIVILCVMAARLALKRAPKVFSYALWAAVLFRLLCPVSLSAGFSLLGVLDAPVKQAGPAVSTLTYVQPQQQPETLPQTQMAEPDAPAFDSAPPVTPVEQEQKTIPGVDWPAVAAWGWLTGAAGMAGYSVVTLLRLRRRLVGSLHLRDNLYLADHISTPFVLGLVRPKIYLPSTLTEGEMGYIIRHEQYHIRHGDHVVKVLAFAALCLHWFNPLVWAAFVLAGRDMEMRCDEAVVKELGEKVKADYSASLLTLATGRLTIAGTPLAFGEGNPEGRIRNLLRWKRPRVWLSAVACMACVAVIAACAANPAGQTSQTPAGESGQYESMEDFAQQTMEGAKEVSYYSYSGEETTARVTGTKVAWLDKMGEVEGLAPEGTLEAWTFHYLVQIDAPVEEVALTDGMYQEDGWFDLEGQGGRNIVAVRYSDGTYDILYDQPVNDDLDFYGYHNSYEEAIYDWYVAEKGLDLPPYVEEWSVLDLGPSGEENINIPVHRYDGDGWYLYIPVVAWKQTSADPVHSVWVSEYDTGSAITVDYTKTNLADYLAGDTRGMTPAGDSGRVFEAQGDGWNYRYYYVEGTEGCWRITIQWQDGGTDGQPLTITAVAAPKVLALMAESFQIYHFAQTGNTVEPDSVTQAKEDLKQAVEGELRLIHKTGSSVQGLVVNPEVLSMLSGLTDLAWEVQTPEWYVMENNEDWPPLFTQPNTVSVILDQEQGWGFCFRTMTDAGTYQVRVDYGKDGKACTYYLKSSQMYLYLTAVMAYSSVELHDLDDDGIYEVLAWPAGEKRNLIIYDFYGNEVHKIDVVQELGAEYADYTGLIGNIQREYSNMVQARVDGEDGIYQYKDGTLTYICTLEKAQGA